MKIVKRIKYKKHLYLLGYHSSGSNWVLKLLSRYLYIPFRDINIKHRLLERKRAGRYLKINLK